MFFSKAFTALCAASLASAAPNVVNRAASGFNWGNEKIKGCNIGGWLVLEPYITPSIFKQFPDSKGIVDEYTLTKSLGAQQAYNQVLKKHWETFARWEDFKRIKDAGFNAVRIPIGFWAYDNAGTPYASGAAPFIDAAIDWARSLGLKVLIDLHGAPGSQNCFDNSGRRCDKPQWTTGDTTRRTLNVLYTMQKKYGDAKYDDVIMGIELLNEPLTPELNLDTVKQFWRDGFGQQRTVSQSRVVVIQDGFQNTNTYNGFLTPSDHNAQNVALDHHEYQVFTNDLVSKNPEQHRAFICENAHTYNGADKWTFVGEWSAALTDCGYALNGWGRGARYDGTFQGSHYVGSCAGWNDIKSWNQQRKDDTRAYIEGQMEAFEKYTQGWFFWNFKTEGSSPDWNLFALLDNGVFPQPLNNRKFGAICS